MSHLVARPGRNAAREAKRLKEIRKVKVAIQWQEQERKKRQKILKERWEVKSLATQRIRAETANIRAVKRRALKNVKEDWQLGPLRPNRAFGEDADKYGSLTAQYIQNPNIPVDMQKHRNEVRERRGQELEYPLVVDDKKYFPIAKDDRVLVVEGRAKNKIGIVMEVLDRTHQVRLKGINMQYYDSGLFSIVGPDLGPKREAEVPIDMKDVRLVIPYELTQDGQTGYQDVVVDRIIMERHSTGIDPYTGTDYGDAKIPEEHQNDPKTGLAIFHRYIAGTRHRIPWPYEPEFKFPGSSTLAKETSTKGASGKMISGSGTSKSILSKSVAKSRVWLRRALGTLRHPITSLKSWRNRGKKGTKVQRRDRAQMTIRPKRRPRSQKGDAPNAFDMVDTTRNIVEAETSMAYTILSPPMPNTLREELQGEIRGLKTKAKQESKELRKSVQEKRISRPGATAHKTVHQNTRAVGIMKTPMQLRWELEHAKKLQQQAKSPLVEMDSLLAALGQHMLKNKVKIPRSKSTARLGDVD